MTASAGATRVSAPHARPVLSRDVADFLIAFSGAFQRFSMYPEGHPALDEAVRNLSRKLEILFLERPGLTVGATPTQLVISGVPTDPEHALLRDLAGHLHNHGIGGIRVLRGVKRSELGGLLTRITREATAASPEVRDSPTRVLWPHLRLYPLNYAQLELIEEDEEDQAMAAEAGDAWAQRLWLNLARAALAEDEVEEDADVDPLTVAVAIDARPYDPEYDRRILASLTDFAEACRGRGRSELVAVQRHLARLIGALSRPTLQRLLALRGDGALQRHFLLEVSHVMAADVVLGLVQQAAEASERSIAPGLLQLLGKLASHAEDGPAARRPWADQAFRELIGRLVDRWDEARASPAPEFDANRMERQSHVSTPASDRALAYAPDPERILIMSLEGSFLESGTLRAVDSMIARGHTWKVLDVLQTVPHVDPIGRELRARVFHPRTVSVVLSMAPIDVRTLDRLVPSCGNEAIGPMLDALASEKDRRIRSKLLDMLSRFGSPLGPEAVGRLKDAPWYVQRNLVKLLGTLPSLPEEFSPKVCLAHPDARVRIEGLKLLLKDPITRGRALTEALGSADPPTMRLGLVAALESCPKDGAGLIMERLLNHSMPVDLRSIGLRAIAPVQEPEVLQCLWKFCVRSRWLFGIRLAPKSPEMLAALAGLSAHWRSHPQVGRVVDAGVAHKDKEIREAAGAARLLPGVHAGMIPKVIM